MNNKMNIPLSGIIPPLVTPLLDDDVLDVEGLQRLIEHLIAGEYMLFLCWELPVNHRASAIN